MIGSGRKKSLTLRRIFLSAAWLVMAGTALYYLWIYRELVAEEA